MIPSASLTIKCCLPPLARHQKVVVRNYSNATGLEDYLFALYPKPLDADVWPGVQAVEQLSLYANHTEALQPGSVAPDDGGQCRAEYRESAHSKQDEVGVKIDYRYDRRIAGAV
ncbi:putative TonB-dependent receptor [Klebsiella pneumoniae]|uniref:Putative TonB-dependent receptor n=1 Tax=Klebsiella pneumoniae TaxID=573 RepID=A0A377XN05_KLEPN|nr:putative TonB-dependent receptor [Klebsiella pneumoniae]